MDWLQVPSRVQQLFPLCAASFQDAYERDLDEFDAPELGWLCKQGTAFKPVADLWQKAQVPFGGPNPLTAMLLTGATGAGLGYLGSKALSAFTPDRYIDDKKRTRNWAMLGGLAGAALPGYLWARPAMQLHGWQGLLKKSNLPDDPVLRKCAVDAGATFAPIVPVDAFNRVILTDEYLPPYLRAATAGLTTAAQLSQGGAQYVSPADIGRVAVGMGSGLLAGMVVGKVLGALAGVRPEVQKTLQQTGALAGLLKSVIPLVFE